MNKTNFVRILVISVLIIAISIDCFADIRIRFAHGRTSATTTGKISNGGRVCYIAGGKHGQSLTATVSSSTGKVQIFESVRRATMPTTKFPAISRSAWIISAARPAIR